MGQVAVLARRGPMTAPGARGGPSVAGRGWGGTGGDRTLRLRPGARRWPPGQLEVPPAHRPSPTGRFGGGGSCQAPARPANPNASFTTPARSVPCDQGPSRHGGGFRYLRGL